jgi:hypothetical protein
MMYCRRLHTICYEDYNCRETPKSAEAISGVPRGVWGGGSTPPPKFRSFVKAQPNSQFRGKYIRNCLVFLFHHPN